MNKPTSLQCPQCGGRREKDLRSMRRITGWALIVVAFGALAGLAVVPWRAPWWSLVGCVATALLGVVALLGAGAARYCAECNVRMEARVDDRDRDQGRS